MSTAGVQNDVLELYDKLNDEGAGITRDPLPSLPSTPDNIDHLYKPKRERILYLLRDLIKQAELITGFCNDPRSIVRLTVASEHWPKLYVAQYPMPQALVPLGHKIIERWYHMLRIEKYSHQYLKMFNNPILLVPKRNADGKIIGVRVCIDPRVLNKYLI